VTVDTSTSPPTPPVPGGVGGRLRGLPWPTPRVAGLLGLGVLVGLLWAVGTPFVRNASDGIEDRISGEVTFTVLGLVVGVGVALAGLVRPHRRPFAAAVVDLCGSVPASALAWGVGRLAGAPPLTTPGAVLVWPLAAAGLTAIVSLALVLLHSEPDGP
jgi:hypothetical protein